jgi:hypothetical protein
VFTQRITRSSLVTTLAAVLFWSSGFAPVVAAPLGDPALPGDYSPAVSSTNSTAAGTKTNRFGGLDLSGLHLKGVRVTPAGDSGSTTAFTGRASPADDLNASRAQPAGGAGDDADEWVVAPIPFLKPAFGWGLGIGVAYLYHPNWAGSNAPPWETGAGVFYTENESWGGAAAHRMNWNEDRWRLLVAGAYADLRYDFYGVGVSQGDTGLKIPLRQEATGGTFELLRQVSGRWYAGARFLSGDIQTSIDGSQLDLPSQIAGLPLQQRAQLSAFGLHILRDSRDNQYYPTRGSLLDVKADFFTAAVGSDAEYQSYSLAYNYFHELGARQVLALRATGQAVSGGAPFFALPSFGAKSDLRGYTPGRYQDQCMIATQAEYRLRLGARFGMVVFAGVGGVAPDLGGFETLLPSIGTGVRYVIAQENQISLRFDVAWGRKDRAFYLAIGEAF